MKKWNAPEVVELNINETANGWSHSGKEQEWQNDPDNAHGVHGGSKPEPKPEPSTPDTLS